MGSDIVNIPLHILLKNFEQQCNGINICGASLPEAFRLVFRNPDI